MLVVFCKVNMLVNFIRSSKKRQELLRDKQVTQFSKLIEEGQIETGYGLNQESFIARAGDTRWSSHFMTLTSLMTLYGAIIGVLEEVGNDTSFAKYGKTMLLLDRDQDLLNALSLVNATKQELQEMRNDGWEELISKVMEVCSKLNINVPNMDASYVQGKKPRRHATTSSLHELNARFDEENTELLECVLCLSPSSSFATFDVKKLLRMVELYPVDFVDVPEVVVLLMDEISSSTNVTQDVGSISDENKESWQHFVFHDLSSIKDFYAKYAHEKGFNHGFKHGSRADPKNKTNSDTPVLIEYQKEKELPEERTGCPASISLKYNSNVKGYHIYKWNVTHNHPLHKPEH
ncbi:uncharacterized protein LOC131650484 [Vicia villosa]|uniref:uncharacterized protein LOC131650484 n=1 Tax=Vicia villosa TaxID=3911 RepID=UPI00273B90DC|nr:uncharacterized protein LOC131650484 [Vicia villosa]